VKWVRGSKQEAELVRRIFDTYANAGISVVKLATQLEQEGVRTRDGHRVTEWMLYSFLRSETVIGNFVWGRAENKKRRREDDERFRRASGVIEQVVSRQVFDAVQAKLARRKHVILTREGILAQLRDALASNPRLRGSQLKSYGLPCRETYRKHFGSLAAAWAEAGASFPSGLDGQDFIEMEHSAATGAAMCTRVCSALSAAGIDCRRYTRADRRGQTILINGRTVLRVQVIWKRPRYDGMQWSLRKIYNDRFDWVLVVRLREDDTARDSVLLRRDDYFAQEKWMQDQLTGGWRSCTSVEKLLAMFGDLGL
jgi:hypothetical protein